jgi:hypothetical protein
MIQHTTDKRGDHLWDFLDRVHTTSEKQVEAERAWSWHILGMAIKVLT